MEIKMMMMMMMMIGQTGQSFNTRYKEHIHDIRHNNSNSVYSNHILNTIYKHNRHNENHKN
jgi:hypothetical protein